jgi:hypothetical protein
MLWQHVVLLQYVVGATFTFLRIRSIFSNSCFLTILLSHDTGFSSHGFLKPRVSQTTGRWFFGRWRMRGE